MHQSWPTNQLAKGMESNAACLQCHPSFEKGPEQHTHHAAGSSGSLKQFYLSRTKEAPAEEPAEDCRWSRRKWNWQKSVGTAAPAVRHTWSNRSAQPTRINRASGSLRFADE